MKTLLYKILPICILLIFYSDKLSYAQIVIPAENIDGVRLSKNKDSFCFYQEKNHQYRRIDIDLEKKGPDRVTPIGRWQTFQEIMQPGETWIGTDSIKSFNPKAFLKYLSKYQFLSFYADERFRDTTSGSLQLLNPYTALYRELDSFNQKYVIADPDKDEDQEHYNFEVVNFVMLQLRPDKCLLFYSFDDGYFIPGKKEDHIFFKNKAINSIVKQKRDNSWKKSDEITRQVIKSADLVNHYYVIDTGNKQALADNDDNLVLPDLYDSIYMFNYFIFASKNGKTDVYNVFLEPLIKGVSAYAPNEWNAELAYVLNKNKKDAIDFRGTINPSKNYPPISISSYHHNYLNHFDGSSVRLDKDKNSSYLLTVFNPDEYQARFQQRNDIILPSGVAAQAASFFGHLLCERPDEDTCGWFILKLDNLYGVYYLKYPKVAVSWEDQQRMLKVKRDTIYYGSAIECKQLLPIKFDSIKPCNEDGHNRVLIYKNGLSGIYPIQNEAKYKSIQRPGFGPFLRFELPDGRKGWLNLFTKREYFDL